MTTGIIVLLVVVALTVLIGLGVTFGLFRIERKKVEPMEEESQQETPEEEMRYTTGLSVEEPEEEHVDFFEYSDSQEEEKERPVNEAHVIPFADDELDMNFDKLCSLKTGRSYLVECQKNLNLAQQNEQIVVMVYFDFDRFRLLNSLKGQSTGDYVLTHIAQDMETIFPHESLITRVSADHFTVLFPVSDEDYIQEYTDQLKMEAERIRQDVAAKTGLRIYMGIAVAKYERDYDISLLLQRANVARHCMKITRSDTYYGMFDPTMLTTYLYGESAMESYRENQYGEEFSMFLQPIGEIGKGRIAAGDVLALWQCEEEFKKNVPLLPDNGRLPTNNTKVIYRICKWLGRWKKSDKPSLKVFAYLPVTDFYKEDIDAFVAQCCLEAQLDEEDLVIQVDIATIRMDWTLAEKQLQKLKDVGVSTAVMGIDRGYTSLESLEGLPLDYVKFHKSFAYSMLKGEEFYQEVKNIIQSAADIQVRTVFEGVDNQEQALMLRKAGAFMLQGRYAGYVSQPDDFERNIRDYVLKQGAIIGSTSILDDDSLSKGDFQVY